MVEVRKDGTLVLSVNTATENFRTAPYLVMHAPLIGDTLNNKAL